MVRVFSCVTLPVVMLRYAAVSFVCPSDRLSVMLFLRFVVCIDLFSSNFCPRCILGHRWTC